MLARAAVIILLGFIAYGAMLPAPFRVMDDRVSIVENPAVKSFQNVLGIFREGYFHDQSYYRPLVNLSFMAEYRAFGLKSFFYNCDNLILHILNALLVVLLVARLTNDDTMGFWTGLLFVLHPLQWEAVCNIPGRSILLSAFLALAAFNLFLCSRPGLVLVSFFLALLCKESAGVLPFVIGAYLALDKERPWFKKLKALWPFYIGLGLYLILRIALGITDLHQSGQPLGMLLGFVTFLRSVVTDLRLLVLPVDLHYDRSLPFMMSLGAPQAMATMIFWLVAVLVLVLNRRRISPFVLFLMAWFALELLPVSQLVTSIGTGAGHISTAEHFLYVACIPAFIGMVMAFRWVYSRNTINPAFMKLLAGGFLVFLLLTAVEQSIYASNEFNMVSRSLSFEPNNARLQGEMAMLAVFRNDIPEAEKHFRLAVDAEPMDPKYHAGLGTALCQQGRFVEGLEQFVGLKPLDKDKATVERQEKMAFAQIEKQIKQGKSLDSKGWLAIGIYEAQTGHNPQALDAFTKSTQLDPNQADAWFNLGSIYEAQKEQPQAKAAYNKLLSLGNITPFQRGFAIRHLENMSK